MNTSGCFHALSNIFLQTFLLNVPSLKGYKTEVKGHVSTFVDLRPVAFYNLRNVTCDWQELMVLQ